MQDVWACVFADNDKISHRKETRCTAVPQSPFLYVYAESEYSNIPATERFWTLAENRRR